MNQEILLKCLVMNLIGWSESVLRRARPRRKPSRRYSPGDDRSERDRVYRWVTHSDLWRLGFTLPHALWPTSQCVAVPWALLRHRGTAQKKTDQVPTSFCCLVIEEAKHFTWLWSLPYGYVTRFSMFYFTSRNYSFIA